MAGQVIVLLGLSGAGKSMQARRLEQRGWKWLSSGEILRHSAMLAQAVTGGHLVNSASVEQVVGAALQQIDMNTKIVLDGFPREVSEQQWLNQKLAQLGRPLTHAILIQVSPETAVARLASRGRQDDTATAQAAKWHDYQSLTVPVIERYRTQGILYELDGNNSIEAVGNKIDQLLSK